MMKLRRTLKAIVIDGDERSNSAFKKMCENYFSRDIEIIECFTTANKAIRVMRTLDIELDVIFIESQFSSISVLNFIASKPFGEYAKFVFLSKDDKHVLQAIRLGVFDYLKKPCRVRDFRLFIGRLSEYFRDKIYELDEKVKDNILLVNGHDKALFLDVCEILRIEANGSYTDIYLEKGGKVSSSKSLSFYQSLLESHQFFKVHRSHLVNINKVKELVKYDGEGVLVLNDHSKIVISKGKKNEFLRSFTKQA